MTGFIISHIAVTGPGKTPATLSFAPGLNVIAGASNTGKTYVFQVLDFLLGASEPPKAIPEAVGYTHASIELVMGDGDHITLRRPLAGGDAELLRAPLGTDAVPTILGASHARGNLETISGKLLSAIGLWGKELRKNERGEKRSLSFRDIAYLTLVDEERIITDRSPALSGQYIERTAEQMVFGLLLTGTDDAAIIPREDVKQRKLRISTELDLLGRLIEDTQHELEGLGLEGGDFTDQHQRVRGALRETGQLVVSTQSQIDGATRERDEAWKGLQDIESRRGFLLEQAKRLRLLREHYASDSARLTSALEAGRIFAGLPTGACPVCGHVSAPNEPHETDERLVEFHSACLGELRKIEALSRDLEASLEDLQREDGELAVLQNSLRETLERANATITTLLAPKVHAAASEMTRLLELDDKLGTATSVSKHLQELQSRRAVTEQSLSIKVPKSKLAAKVETHTAAGFCEVVSETLKAWKFPNQGVVSFDPSRFDIVLGDQNRGSVGKGYRAVTHAAFTVGLLRYCRKRGLPHSGLVALDTPLNPFKGPDTTSGDRVNQEVQAAFYADLSASTGLDQVIILENTEPPGDLIPRISYVHFSGTAGAGRAGFFPVSNDDHGVG